MPNFTICNGKRVGTEMQLFCNGKRVGTEMQLSRREIILKRIFKMSLRRGKYTANDYHDFCNWAKGKSESALLRGIGV